MANIIKIKSGSGVPTTSDLADKEIAFDTSGDNLYVRDGNDIIEFLSGTGAADQIIFTAKADVALTKGDVVYITGISGNTPTVSKADADDSAKMPAFGLAGADISATATGNIVTFGVLSNIDTSSFSVGDILYVSTTAGSVTATKPTGESASIQNIGMVERSHATAGRIKVGGAGRTNDVPNLNQDKIFLGNASNQAVSTALSSIGLSKFNNDSGYLTAHPNISAASSSDNGGRTYIQDITLDSNGHVTGIATATETVTDTNTTYSGGTGITLSGTTFNLDADVSHNSITGTSTNTNKIDLDDDQTGASNMLTITSLNHTNILTDNNNNGTGDFRVYNGSNDIDTADLAFRVNSVGNTIVSGNLTINGTISGNAIKDEDNMSSNSASHAATQQSIKAYVDAEVAGIVNSAPAALNTLDELAAALGDDANFATTTSTALGNRLRVDTASQGLTGTQQANAITNLGITATKAELNYVDGVTSNIQTQLNGKLSTSGTAANSQLLDSIDSTGFTRKGVQSGTPNTASSRTTFTCNDALNVTTGNQSGLEVWQDTAGADAFMTFHVANDYAVYFGLDGGTNDLAVGGWSRGANSYKIWHQGNDGTGSGLDADTLDGVQGSSFLRSDATDTASSKITFTNGMQDNVSNVGTVGSSGLEGNQLSTTDWSNLPVGFGGMMRSQNQSYGNPGSNYFYFHKIANRDSGGGWGGIAVGYNNNAEFYVGTTTVSGSYATWSKVWNESNDGSGSGLDADLLDGSHASAFATLSGSQTFTGIKTFTEALYMNASDNTEKLYFQWNGTTVGDIGGQDTTWLRINQATAKNIYTPRLIRADNGFFVDGQTLGIDGSGNVKVNSTVDSNTGNLTLRRAASDNDRIVIEADQHSFYVNGTKRLEVKGNGTVQVNGTLNATADVVAYFSSDKRLKDNLKPIENSLDKVSKLSGYEFDWNDKQETYQGHDIGVVAQEVEEVLPELVATREDGYKAVKYEKIVALLIESIKELKAEVEELKK